LPLDLKVRGQLLHHVLRDALTRVRVHGRSHDEIVEGIKAGRFSLLFDEKGDFINQPSAPDS